MSTCPHAACPYPLKGEAVSALLAGMHDGGRQPGWCSQYQSQCWQPRGSSNTLAIVGHMPGSAECRRDWTAGLRALHVQLRTSLATQRSCEPGGPAHLSWKWSARGWPYRCQPLQEGMRWAARPRRRGRWHFKCCHSRHTLKLQAWQRPQARCLRHATALPSSRGRLQQGRRR